MALNPVYFDRSALRDAVAHYAEDVLSRSLSCFGSRVTDAPARWHSWSRSGRPCVRMCCRGLVPLHYCFNGANFCVERCLSGSERCGSLGDGVACSPVLSRVISHPKPADFCGMSHLSRRSKSPPGVKGRDLCAHAAGSRGRGRIFSTLWPSRIGPLEAAPDHPGIRCLLESSSG